LKGIDSNLNHVKRKSTINWQGFKEAEMRTDAYITAEAPSILLIMLALVRPFVNALTQAVPVEPDRNQLLMNANI
jgi:hypothetical protein